MKKCIKRSKIKGFTLVELLAVIVILAIILVIAVPKVMSVIEDAKKATLESSAKMIASQAEKQKVQNAVLGNDKEITCKDITNISDVDYASCEITFDNNTAKVSIEGSGKFEGLYVCNGTKTDATAQTDECSSGGGITYAELFADNSWETIAYACQNDEVPDTWAVGDTKTMSVDGVEYNVTIIGTDHDTYSDGGIAPLTFQTDIVSTHVMNSTNTNAGGWAGSEMYSYLNTDLINDLEFASYIQPVVKSTNKGYADSGNTAATEAVDSNDKLFLLSRIEVFGTQSAVVYNLEGSQYAYYAAGNSKIKNYDRSTGFAWWLRSPIYNISNEDFVIVDANGGIVDYIVASNTIGVTFGFCF